MHESPDILDNLLGDLRDHLGASLQKQERKQEAFVSYLAGIVDRLHDASRKETPHAAINYLEGIKAISYHVDLAHTTYNYLRESIDGSGQRSQILISLGKLFESLGNYDNALAVYDELRQSFDEGVALDLRADANLSIGSILSERGQWQEAESALRQAAADYERAGNAYAAHTSRFRLAMVDFRRGNLGQAREAYEALLPETSSSLLKAEITNALGIIKRVNGDYEGANEAFQEALISFQRLNHSEGTADCLSNLGVMAMQHKRHAEAKNYFDKALAASERTGQASVLAFIQLNRGELLLQTQDIALAASAIGRALEYLTQLKNPIGLARTNRLLGRCFWQLRDLQAANRFYQESLNLYQNFDIPLGLVSCSREYAEMLREAGAEQQAANVEKMAAQQAKDLADWMKGETQSGPELSFSKAEVAAERCEEV